MEEYLKEFELVEPPTERGNSIFSKLKGFFTKSASQDEELLRLKLTEKKESPLKK